MLVYHPMFDPYHCAVRVACIAVDSEIKAIEWDRLRLLDFFVTFPHLLKTIRIPQELRASRAMLKRVPEPYESLPSPSRLFFQLSEIQATAVRMLVASGFLSPDSFRVGQIELCKTQRRQELARVLEGVSFRTSEWYRFLVGELTRFPLKGKDGFGLMEFRHDSV
jgi:hypothetical protein